jgi:hypothetical protein
MNFVKLTQHDSLAQSEVWVNLDLVETMSYTVEDDGRRRTTLVFNDGRLRVVESVDEIFVRLYAEGWRS